MNIHEIIAAAKRDEIPSVIMMKTWLAMAEALARIAATRIYAANYESAILDMEALQDIARDVLAKIEKEAQK